MVPETMFSIERLFVRLIKGSLAGWIKIVSSRCPSLQAGTISSSAITRSGQAALRRLGIYSGQVDGILGPDTHGAIEDYQLKKQAAGNRPAGSRAKHLAGHILGPP
jgi:peptidoglycan hydrolase-like protein with peptidoglycan-binding domain